MGDSKPPETGLSEKGKMRRNLLKAAAIVGAGVVVVGAAKNLGGEANGEEQGIDTAAGTFFQIYEGHERGINPEDIPPDLDVFSKEAVLNSREMLEVEPKLLLKAQGVEFGQRSLPDQVLSTLARNKVEIMFCDVDIPDKERHLIGTAETLAGVLLVMSSIENARGDKFTTREFLKLGAATWLLSPNLGYLSVYLSGEQRSALSSIINRVHAIQSDLHPERIEDFFRSAVYADKLLTVAQSLGEKASVSSGKKPRLTIQAGAAHGGVEDFLRAGPDVCRAIILAYPAPILRRIVEMNGDVEAFCSSRLLKLPENTDDLSKTTSRVVVDTKLKDALEKKLSE